MVTNILPNIIFKFSFIPVNINFSVDLLLDWKQNAYDVIVRLNCGDSGVLRVEDIDSAFSDTSCHIRLPGKESACVRLFGYMSMLYNPC